MEGVRSGVTELALMTNQASIKHFNVFSSV